MKRMRFVQTEIFFWLRGTSYEVLERFQKLIESQIDVEELLLVTIDYDTRQGDVEEGPVKLYFADGAEVRLNLTAGYNGSGPNDLCRVLELCNVHFNKADIVSKQDEVHLKYYLGKDDVTYQFQDFEGNHVYSM